MSKHTPGPWIADDRHVYTPNNGPHIANATQMASKSLLKDQEQNAIACANARLIAAAPEMLAALLHIRRYLERTGESMLLDSFGIHDAIAKATGGTLS